MSITSEQARLFSLTKRSEILFGVVLMRTAIYSSLSCDAARFAKVIRGVGSGSVFSSVASAKLLAAGPGSFGFWAA